MKLIIFLIVILSTSELVFPKNKVLQKWIQFKKRFNRKFHNYAEELFRREIFIKKFKEVEEHNNRYRKGLESYLVGINQFSDFTNEELLKYTHSYMFDDNHDKPLSEITKKSLFFSKPSPEFVDWRKKGMVTPIKDQKGCGACWAFATTGAIESHYKIYKNTSLNLSEQQLIDCVHEADGCVGGWMSDGYTYIVKNGGISDNTNYPYQATDNRICDKSIKSKVQIKGFGFLNEANEDILKNIVANKGPVSVAFDAEGNFADYVRGIYFNPLCTKSNFTHAGLIVGYGTESYQDYWIVKNSWGVEWGLNGYFKIARNKDNHCGIASKATYPII